MRQTPGAGERGGRLSHRRPRPAGESPVARENGLPTQRGERGRGQRGLSLHRHQGVVVAQGHRGVRLLVGKAGEDGIIIIEEKVQAVLQQGVRVEAGLGEPGGDVHPDGVAAVVLDGEVIGGGGGGALLNGVVEAHAAGGDPDGQQQEQTDHRHGEIGGVDAAVELPQHKHIETFVVELFPALHHPEEKARERAEEQQGPQGAQGQHEEKERVDIEQSPEEQHGVGGEQQRDAGQKGEHAPPQGALPHLLVSAPALHEVDEPGPGDGQTGKDHDQ